MIATIGNPALEGIPIQPKSSGIYIPKQDQSNGLVLSESGFEHALFIFVVVITLLVIMSKIGKKS